MRTKKMHFNPNRYCCFGLKKNVPLVCHQYHKVTKITRYPWTITGTRIGPKDQRGPWFPVENVSGNADSKKAYFNPVCFERLKKSSENNFAHAINKSRVFRKELFSTKI